MPFDTFEKLQIQRYKIGEHYKAHFDSEEGVENKRVATMLIYLSDVEEGGETVFPLVPADSSGRWADFKDSKVSLTFGQDNWAALCKSASMLRVKPVKGTAVLFFTLRPNGEVDPLSLHGSCAVNKGQKWIAQQWIHEEPIDIRVSTDVEAFFALDIVAVGVDAVLDTSNRGYDMLISSGGIARANKGIAFKGSCTACSAPGPNLMRNIRDAHGLTISFWVRLNNVKEKGRANLVTISNDGDESSKEAGWRFSIWQKGRDMFFEGPQVLQVDHAATAEDGDDGYEFSQNAELKQRTWAHVGLVVSTIHQDGDTVTDVRDHWNYNSALIVNGQTIKVLQGRFKVAGLNWDRGHICAGPGVPEQAVMHDLILMSRCLTQSEFDRLYRSKLNEMH